jgi:hypothetical protein
VHETDLSIDQRRVDIGDGLRGAFHALSIVLAAKRKRAEAVPVGLRYA